MRPRAGIAGDRRVEPRLGRGVDDRADMGREATRVADPQLPRGADEHGHGGRKNILLEAQQAQGGTALAGRAKGRGKGVVDHLFDQGRGIGNPRVDPSSFGDQRRDGAGLCGKGSLDRRGRSRPSR